jgi:hypothetical protein
VVVVSVAVVPRLAIDSFAVAIPFADLSRATDDACSASETVHAVPVSPAETEALVATDAFSSRVDAPAICARSTMTARTAAIIQIPRWFMHALLSEPEGPREFPPTDA